MENLKCSSCGKQDKTVALIECGYSKEIGGVEVVKEIVCDDCEHEHLMDI